MAITPPPEPVYEQVARLLRDRIYSGVYPVGGKVASAPELARELGCSVPVVVRAFGRLRDEGLVRTAPGDATYVEPRQRFHVEVTLSGPGERLLGQVRRAVAAALSRDPALSGLTVTTAAGTWRWVAVAETADAGAAVRRVLAAVRVTADDRWRFAQPNVTVRPDRELTV